VSLARDALGLGCVHADFRGEPGDQSAATGGCVGAELRSPKKKPRYYAGLIIFNYDPDASLSAPAGRGQKFVAKKSPSLALRRVASSRTQFSSRLERWGYPRPNLKAGVSVHASRRPGQPANGVAAATRARVDAPSFFPYLSKPCRVFASRITRETRISPPNSSKPGASAWMPR
jgi:hypothetical protein